MAKRFKAKRKFSFKKTFKVLIIIFIIFMIYQIINYLVLSIKLTNSNELFIKYILQDTNYYSYYEKKSNNLVNKIINYISNNTLNKPVNILQTTFKYKNNTTDTMNSKDNTKLVLLKNEQLDNEVLVYIYNSHQTESYSMKYLEEYNIKPDVLMASYILQEKLNNLNINTAVLEENISNYLKENKLDYSKSYEASRHFIEPIIKENDSIILYIDLHRDATTHEISSTTIDNLECAKVLFIVGEEYSTYQKNYDLANEINNKIKEKYPELTRGVMLKKGSGVNGVYNQDLKENMILLELGGNNNNIEEVTNTINLIAPIIGDYVNEKRK